ncbi:alpha/beta hydrolase fold domain-containing protein [Mycobacterium asiaticum]|uniref:alpha/beta hydrolase fold domain-containing protein n=1 Tax=Mycobacterium asiaticum TaxID=1790 RepID=UPI0009BEC72B|nr:alpha/beta hydrolase fold domain-containing protein [Mycobacterium asiaticum]
MKRPVHRPHVTQRLLRASGVRNRLFPPAKLASWEANPRPPYCGRPSKHLLKKIDVARDDVNGRPVYQVTPRHVPLSELSGHLIYLHGGAYVLDLLPHFHWPAIAKLANLLRRTITVPIYPIAPEHTYREVFPFLLQLYRRILAERDPNSLAFMGDSAGGGMAFALCHAVRDAGLPQPTDAVLLSPWMHLGLPDPEVLAVAKKDPFLNLDDLRAAGLRYAGGDPLDTPLLSPSVGPLDGLPRLTVFTGTHDVLNPDARAFYKRATAEGVEIGWYELEGGMHTWMLLPGHKAKVTLEQIRQVLSG